MRVQWQKYDIIIDGYGTLLKDVNLWYIIDVSFRYKSKKAIKLQLHNTDIGRQWCRQKLSSEVYHSTKVYSEAQFEKSILLCRNIRGRLRGITP